MLVSLCEERREAKRAWKGLLVILVGGMLLSLRFSLLSNFHALRPHPALVTGSTTHSGSSE